MDADQIEKLKALALAATQAPVPAEYDAADYLKTEESRASFLADFEEGGGEILEIAQAIVKRSRLKFPSTNERCAAAEHRADIAEMVNRFLAWHLPDSITSSMHLEMENPIGTHLMSADDAKAMFEYVIAAPSPTGDMT